MDKKPKEIKLFPTKFDSNKNLQTYRTCTAINIPHSWPAFLSVTWLNSQY